jgi:NAD-dependent DNA ligase
MITPEKIVGRIVSDRNYYNKREPQIITHCEVCGTRLKYVFHDKEGHKLFYCPNKNCSDYNENYKKYLPSGKFYRGVR